MRLACVKCGTFLKILTNGVCIEEGFGDEVHRPYKLWMSDVYKCERCGVEVAKLAGGPMTEHYMSDFKEMQSVFPDRVIVNDCPGSYNGPERAESIVRGPAKSTSS